MLEQQQQGSTKAAASHAALAKMNTDAVRLLCEGQSEEAMTLLCACLSKAKLALKQAKKVQGDVDPSSSSCLSTQISLTEIPVEGAIGEDIYDASERDTRFCLYQCALVTSQLSNSTADEEDANAFKAWCERLDQQQAAAAAAQDVGGVSKTFLAVPVYPQHHHHPVDEEEEEEEEEDEVYDEPWHYSTLLTFCSVVTFNLGIVFHELGLSEGRLPHLAKARSLYNMGLLLLNEQQRSNHHQQLQQDENPMPNAWLKCALHNNLGHLAAFFSDYNALRKARKGLQASLRAGLPAAPLFQASLAMARDTTKHSTASCTPAAAA